MAPQRLIFTRVLMALMGAALVELGSILLGYNPAGAGFAIGFGVSMLVKAGISDREES